MIFHPRVKRDFNEGMSEINSTIYLFPIFTFYSNISNGLPSKLLLFGFSIDLFLYLLSYLRFCYINAFFISIIAIEERLV